MELEELSKIKTRGIILCAKVLDIEYGEKNTKYFLKLEQKQASTKHICCIEKDDGTQLNSPDKILAEEKHFYNKIQQCKDEFITEKRS